MALTPETLDGTLWLAEPGRLLLAARRVLAQTTCPTARQLAKERRRRLEAARAPTVLQGRADAFVPEEQAASKPVRGVKGGIGVIPVYGMIQQRLTSELMKAGGTSVEEISAGLDALLANKAVDAIVLDVDSPGGEVSKVPELSDQLFAARAQKKLYASVNSLAASAGYWIASAAEQVMVTPSGYAGSIGVYMLHEDVSKALDAGGIKVTLVSAGKYKTEGNPFEPLDADARAHLQEQVDATYSKFLKALARNRDRSLDDVRKNFGQGRMMNAEEAVAAGLADRQMSFEDLMARLLGGTAPAGSKGGASAEVLRARHEQEKRRSDHDLIYGNPNAPRPQGVLNVRAPKE